LGGVDSLFIAIDDETDPEYRHWANTHDKVSLIIPPTLDKSVFFRHETLRSLWFQAGRAIAGARRIICMGYSLPGTDLTMAQFLKSCAPSPRIPFEIVNRDSSRREHFAALLGNDTYEFIQNETGDDAVLRFIVHSLAETREDRDYILRMT
jgi:hypothetical protein